MRNQTNITRRVGLPPVSTVSPSSPGGVIDTETLRLLDAWAREDATSDPETMAAAQRDLDEFKRAMNENRASNGEHIVYP